MTDPATRVWAGLRTLVLDLHDRRKEVSAALDLSFFKVKVLRRLVTQPLTMRELVAELGTDAPYLTVLVRDLESRGLVTRAGHPADRRVKIVSLTDEGRRVAARAERLLNTPPAALAELDAADLDTMDRIVETLLGKSTQGKST
jgi:DNA-binding MarR family transcriptional regulator